MTTVFRATGQLFENDNLPTITPFVTRGLVAAWRFNSSPSSMQDLTGNNNTLEKIGNPVFSSVGMKGDAMNGLVTSILETRSLTYISVHKAVPVATEHRAFAVSCYNPSGTTGTGFWVDNNYVVKSTTAAFKNSTALNNFNIFTHVGSNAENYIFTAHVVDADKNEIRGYNPSISSVPTPNANLTQSGQILASRAISGSNFVKIAASELPSWNAESHIIEVLIYDKALSSDEVYQQYIYSKEAIKKQYNINI